MPCRSSRPPDERRCRGTRLPGGRLALRCLWDSAERPDPRPARADRPAYGVDLYLVDNGQLATVLRPTSQPPTPGDTLALLIAGPDPDEHQCGLHTQVPSNLGPVQLTTDASGTTVTMGTDVNALSTMAVSQLVCTAENALASQGQAPSSTPVTLTGGGNSRGPQGCPMSS